MARIIIVDDDLVSQLYMEQILKSLGHDIICKAKSGPEGVEKTKEYLPDIVFMDISMPGDYDGIEAARIIEVNFNIPIIFITAYEIDQFLNRVREVGPFGYIMKPFKEVEVKASIYIALYRKEMENKLKNNIKKYKKSFFFQILISNFLVELNKTYDIYDKLDDLLLNIRKTVEVDSICIYELKENNILKDVCSSIDKKTVKEEFPVEIDLKEFLEKNNFTIDILKRFSSILDFNIFHESFNNYLKSINLKSIISCPIFIDNKLFGLMITCNYNTKSFDIDIRRNLKTISRALSLLFKRHFVSLKMKEIENEKLIQEKINIRKERLATLGQLTSAITHEVNQPLQSIKLLSESPLFWLKEKKKIETNKLLENFEKISERVSRINEIITNLRLLINAPQDIKIKPYNINNIIKELQSLIVAKLKSHGISLELDLDKNIKDILVCSIQLQQVITDIIDNSVNALDKINRINKKIILQTIQTDAYVILKISDNGPGIDKEIKNKIFEPFFSGNNDNSGMGLGLYIVYNIIKAFGANIEVLSEINQGASFVIKFLNI